MARQDPREGTMTRKLMAGGLVLTLLAPLMARADDGSAAMPLLLRVAARVHERIAALGLSDEQRDHMRGVLRGRLAELEATSERAHAAREAVREAVQQDTVDEP